MDRYLYSGDAIVGIVPPTKHELELEQRCDQLEQLCRDMYEQSKECQGHAHYPCLNYDYITDRMEQLGLLDGEGDG